MTCRVAHGDQMIATFQRPPAYGSAKYISTHRQAPPVAVRHSQRSMFGDRFQILPTALERSKWREGKERRMAAQEYYLERCVRASLP